MDSDYAELPSSEENDLIVVVAADAMEADGEELALTEDESMVAMASRREVVSRARRKYVLVTLGSALLIVFPIIMMKLCEIESSSGDECGTWMWIFFVTCPMGVVMLIVGWLVLLCKGLRSL